MGIKEVWGFDPDEVEKAHSLFRGMTDANRWSYSLADELAAGIPPDAESQIYALRRIFRL